MSIYGFHPKELPNYSTWAYYNKAFTPEECQQIAELMPQERLQEATISTSSKTDEKMRKTKVTWLSPGNKETDWIFDRIASFADSCNDGRWGFDLAGFFENIQLTHYD